MSAEDKEQLESRKAQLRSGLKDMATQLFGNASSHLEAARREHPEHLKRLSKNKRRAAEGDAPGGADGAADP
eukprot:7178959-Pyramimonas_sp.AAC.1